MRYKIANDARPQVNALLAAAALGLALWFVPYAWVLAYPFKLFVTFIHEGGHALAALTAVFGFVVPLTNFSFSPFTVVSGALITAGLLAAAKYAPPRVRNFLVSFLAVECVLGALYDLRNLFLLSVDSNRPTDAVNMANIFPAWLWPLSTSIFWAVFWIAVSLAILSLALRCYAVCREKPAQQDLPFEDSPLEV